MTKKSESEWKMTNTRKLKRTDIIKAVEDDRHNGWGYATRDALSTRVLGLVDNAVLRAANGKGWDYEGLFEWTDSKLARWMVDEAYGNVRSAEDADYIAAKYVREVTA